jgi:hypothetical protein
MSATVRACGVRWPSSKSEVVGRLPKDSRTRSSCLQPSCALAHVTGLAWSFFCSVCLVAADALTFDIELIRIQYDMCQDFCQRISKKNV